MEKFGKDEAKSSLQLPENGDEKIKKKNICEQHVTRQERRR